MKRLATSVPLILAFGACAISTQQEVEMGTQYSQQINAQLPIVRDAEINRYINVLGDSIARVADDRGLSWRFFVVDSKEVNAFAVPGGYVYVNRGLIERATKMDMLAGALGHEIGHVVRRHSVKQMEAAQRANVGLTLGCILTTICENQAAGAAINIGGSALFAKFSRDDEAQADEVGVQYTTRAGIDPRGIPEMFRVLLDERKNNGAGVDAWFATHPTEESRIQDTEALIARIPAATLRTLTQDSQAYQAFRRRLLALPVTAAPRQRD
jgi:predicted Zn-dependent protease